MSEFTVRNDTIDVERIMGQIRQRIQEKRDEDYTEEQIRELANVKLERFLDPKNIRSSMAEYYQKRLKEKQEALTSPETPPSFEFDPEIIYRSSRGGRLLYGIRKMLNPLLKLFFNPVPIVHALSVQQQINERQAEVISQMVRSQTEFIEIAALNYEIMNNLVVEMTRLSIEMKNHKMRVESVAGRLDFDERRARSLERVVQYRESGSGQGRASGSATPATAEGEGSPERRRRRRRRGRRRPAGAAAPQGDGTDSGERQTTPGAQPTTPDSVGSTESAPPAQPAPETSSQPPARPVTAAHDSPAPEATGPSIDESRPPAGAADGHEPPDR